MTVNKEATCMMIDKITSKYGDFNAENEDIYRALYENYGGDGVGLAAMHSKFDDLFDFMNSKCKITSMHFNADQSRELISLIEDMRKVQEHYSDLNKDLSICNYYKEKIDYVMGFLKDSGGSPMPDGYEKIVLSRTSAIFTLTEKNLLVPMENNLEGRAREQFEKIENKLNMGDYSGSITNCRTLLENILKKLYKEKTNKPLKGDFRAMWRTFSTEFNLNSREMDQKFSALLDGMSAVINGVAVLRNQYSDGHDTEKSANLSRHHAILVRNSTITMVEFLFATADYQKNKKEPS